MERICGVNLLIPSLEAFNDCPNAVRLSIPSAIVWGILKKESSKDDIVEVFTLITKKKPSEAKNMVDKVLDSFVKAGVIIPEDDS